MKPIGSVTTITPRGQHSQTGTPGGERGLATPASSERVAAWLAKRTPADADKAAVSRASSHGVGLRVRTSNRFPTGPNGEYLQSYAVAVGCDVSPDGDHEAALADLRNFMTPAPIRQIEAWLAELSVTVAKRQDDAMADELRVSVYSSRLARFPADVAKAVLLETSYKFWPTWDEVEKRAKALTGPRAAMIAALERGPDPQEEDRRVATDEEKARIQAMVDEMFPSQSAEYRKDAVDAATRGYCMRGSAQ